MDLLAHGRAADVFDLGDGTVLRRYRDEVIARSGGTPDCAGEAEAMLWAARHGVPVPHVVSAEGADLVMEKVDGPTLLADVARRPWTVRSAGRVLADLHRALDAVPVPDGAPLPAPYGVGTGLLHRDLHPENVILSRRGPVLIDWSNVAMGPRAADVAETWVILACFSPPPTEFLKRAMTAVGRSLFLGAFLGAVDRTAATGWLGPVAAQRESDINTSAGERAAIRSLLAAQGAR